ncbi:unnamed protein product [Bursaphelenchus xylophilus]|uniref:(pine wood nematode) hypothetical protein n=1 Tax=Bursaphelenchus xylophilus TaxID=6326 RepID=A0A7I8XQA0_BURXY|nr:unnamed protein product [Bursaphelenchus xylophilus]CAG9122060.1 unnamed protein product [Bursaphelenchus xylophilus]
MEASYLTIKFATGQCAEPTELSAQALANTYIKSLFLSPEEEEALNTTPEPEPEPQTEATPSNAGWYVFGAGLFLVLSLSIAAAVVLIRKRAKKSVLDRNPLTHVRYDFGLPTQVPALQQKNDRFKEVKLDNGYVVPIPETFCKEYGDVELVSKSQFGLIYKYQWKGPIHVKFEVKLSGYNQPILNEVAICELCTNSDNKLARFLDYKGAYGFYEEGAYALHLSAGVHTLRDLRNGAVMKDVEMAKVAYSALDCVDALEAFGICHRDITEDAFRPQKSIFVLTELGWAVRLGSKRDPYYPHPELASTFIKEKETLPADDAENVIFMLLNMMTDRLPWADTKGIKSITKKKKKFFEECMDGTSLKNNKTAGILCKLRAMIVKTPRNVELAVELKAELINLSKPDDPTLPVEWPGSNDKPTTKSFL